MVRNVDALVLISDPCDPPLESNWQYRSNHRCFVMFISPVSRKARRARASRRQADFIRRLRPGQWTRRDARAVRRQAKGAGRRAIVRARGDLWPQHQLADGRVRRVPL